MKWTALAHSWVILSAWSLLWAAPAFIWAFPDQKGLGFYSLAVGLFLLTFFWPITKFGKLLVIVQNPWINGVGMFVLAIWPFYTIATVLSGIALVISGLLLLCSAIAGESGKTMAQLDKEANAAPWITLECWGTQCCKTDKKGGEGV
eukprot:TRINITY_DN16151_c0_g1_i1.p1 TRINITY_DN16151_c0_g1~~TRINITY_DN16151_c0_g1_i1.p1  ORF type:complete len:155 (-),score=12.17 TRINITY_DN16151_c0_g1_i1:61-501(-)